MRTTGGRGENGAGDRGGSPAGEDDPVSPGLVLLANLTTGATLLIVASTSRVFRLLARRSVAVAALPLLTAAVLTAYVFGEDSYRGNGISRWDAYRSPGGALGPMFVLSVVLMAACAAALTYSGLRGSAGAFRATALAGAITSLLLVTATIIGFTAN